MAVKEKEIKKLYYSIGEVAEMFKVNTSLIRFWEKEFTAIKPKKNKKGNRLFTVKDIETFKVIYQLVKVEGYTLDGAKQKLRSDKEGKPAVNNNELILEKLESLKQNLIDLGKEI